MIRHLVTQSIETQLFHCLGELIPGLATLRTLDTRGNSNVGLPRLDCVVGYGDRVKKELVFFMSNDHQTLRLSHFSTLVVEATVLLDTETVELSPKKMQPHVLSVEAENREKLKAQQSFLDWISQLLNAGYALLDVCEKQSAIQTFLSRPCQSLQKD